MELKSSAQEVCSMSYYSQKLYPFVEKLIRNHNADSGKSFYELSVDELELEEQYHFARHLMIHQKDGLESLYENEDYLQLSEALLTLLFNSNSESKIEFSETILEKVVSFYKDKMQSMIDEAIGWVQQEDMGEAGYSSSKDKVNGETIWLRKAV